MKTIHDQHVHTHYSKDSEADIGEYINRAIELGCSYFVVTDHLDYDLAGTGDDWIADYKTQAEELNKYKEQYKDKITILQGIEIGFKRTYLPQIHDVMNMLDYDVYNLSIHDYKDMDFYKAKPFVLYGVNSMINLYLDLYYDAITSGIEYDVVTHIDYAFATALKIDPKLKFSHHDAKLRVLFQEIIKQGKTLELNTKVQEKINNVEHAKYILNLYYSLGGRDITISSDAHTVDRYLSSFEIYKDIAKEIGFDHLCYFIKHKKYYFDI